MSVQYKAVQWNRHKQVYDSVVILFVVLFIAAYLLSSSLSTPTGQAVSPMILLIRSTGACAVVMLHVILAIGPLARIKPVGFAPLLYNRRHLGVCMFLVALVHAGLVLLWYGSFGPTTPLAAMFTMNPRYDSFVGFPFEVFGLAALTILFFMASTSHDFWLKNLSPRWWKSMHMAVYVAYVCVLFHVALGTIQSQVSLAYALLIAGGVVMLTSLHVVAGLREVRTDAQALTIDQQDWLDVAGLDEIPTGRAKVVKLKGCDSVAIFRYGCDGEKFSAVANVCAHQGGPLGEGKIVNGCITCPWHGYQYLPHNGQSPPPYTEKIATYPVRIAGDRVLIDPMPNQPGTPIEPAVIRKTVNE